MEEHFLDTERVSRTGEDGKRTDIVAVASFFAGVDRGKRLIEIFPPPVEELAGKREILARLAPVAHIEQLRSVWQECSDDRALYSRHAELFSPLTRKVLRDETVGSEIEPSTERASASRGIHMRRIVAVRPVEDEGLVSAVVKQARRGRELLGRHTEGIDESHRDETGDVGGFGSLSAEDGRRHGRTLIVRT